MPLPEHLGLESGEVILFMRPDHLISSAVIANSAERYFADHNIPIFFPTEEEFERHFEGVDHYLRANNRETIASTLAPVIGEYNSFLSVLVSGAGDQKVKLLSTRCDDSLEDNRLIALIQQTASDIDGDLKSNYPQVETVSLTGLEGEETRYPRDLFSTYKTARGHVTFVSPVFPRYIESDNVVRSLLAEGGATLNAGNSMLIAEKVLRWTQIPEVLADLNLLKSLGFDIGFIPRVKLEGQDPQKRFYVETHNDGHAAMLLGKDNTPYLLFAKSYATQDAQSYERLVMASRAVHATSIMVDDANTNHLAFNNILQFPDGTVIYSPAGRYTSEGYQQTALDVTVLHLIDHGALRFTTPFQHLPKITKAGERCTTTMVPEALLRALQI